MCVPTFVFQLNQGAGPWEPRTEGKGKSEKWGGVANEAAQAATFAFSLLPFNSIRVASRAQKLGG